LEAAKRLGEEKYKVQLYTVPIIKPFNTQIILERIQKARAVFTIEEHTIYGGLGSAVAEIIAEE
jgi:transketolase